MHKELGDSSAGVVQYLEQHSHVNTCTYRSFVKERHLRPMPSASASHQPVSYTHLRAHESVGDPAHIRGRELRQQYAFACINAIFFWYKRRRVIYTAIHRRIHNFQCVHDMVQRIAFSADKRLLEGCVKRIYTNYVHLQASQNCAVWSRNASGGGGGARGTQSIPSVQETRSIWNRERFKQ